jgi:hypothetical protein
MVYTYTMPDTKSTATKLSWEKKWFIVEEGGRLIKKELPACFVAGQNGYLIKTGGVRGFVAADKCYGSEQEADKRIASLIDLVEVREELAEYAHNAWSRLFRNLRARAALQPDGSIVVPWELVSQWERQMNTHYHDLTEEEKVSDRAEADKMLDIMAKGARPAPTPKTT